MMLYYNHKSAALVIPLIPTSQNDAASSLNSLFTTSAAVRCAGAIVLLTLLWLGIFWAVSLP